MPQIVLADVLRYVDQMCQAPGKEDLTDAELLQQVEPLRERLGSVHQPRVVLDPEANAGRRRCSRCKKGRRSDPSSYASKPAESNTFGRSA